MVSLLSNSVRLLASTVKQAGGVDIRYLRGSSEVELVAVPGQSDIEGMGIDNEAIVAKADDWLIDAMDLWLDGLKSLPKRGDRILHDGHEYEVVQRGESACYRWTDQTKQILRVYTVEIYASS